MDSASGPITTEAKPTSPGPTMRRQRGVARDASVGGGTQVVLNETGSWSDLADRNPTTPGDSKTDAKGKPSGMLGFLSRKKGRGVSPKPQERGVLGREGFRQVIG